MTNQENTSPEQETGHEQDSSGKVSQRRNVIRASLVILAVVAGMTLLVYSYIFVSTSFGQQLSNAEQTGQQHLELEKKVSDLATQMQLFMEATTKNIEMMTKAQQKIEKELVGAGVDGAQKHDEKTSHAIDEMRAKLEHLEQGLALRQDQMAKIPQSLGLFEKLHDRMQSSRPYDKELQEAKALFDPQDHAMQQRLQTLESYAKTGVPNVEQLREEFRNMTQDLLRLSIPDDLPWYTKLGMRLRNLVVIRKHGQELAPTSTVEDRLTGIDQLLEMGDLESALAETDVLPKFDYQPYTAWRAWADKRLYIEQSLPIMEAHALAHMVNGNHVADRIKGE